MLIQPLELFVEGLGKNEIDKLIQQFQATIALAPSDAKGPRLNNLRNFHLGGRDGVVPVAVEGVTFQLNTK